MPEPARAAPLDHAGGVAPSAQSAGARTGADAGVTGPSGHRTGVTPSAQAAGIAPSPVAMFDTAQAPKPHAAPPSADAARDTAQAPKPHAAPPSADTARDTASALEPRAAPPIADATRDTAQAPKPRAAPPSADTARDTASAPEPRAATPKRGAAPAPLSAREATASTPPDATLPAIPHTRPPGPYARGGKRAFDLFAVLLLLPLALPLLALAAALVWARLGRPILHRAPRLGRDGAVFTMTKLRSMAEGPGEDAARLTRFGRALRASALDELPQLWHVLRGEMSLVGPRPLPPEYRDRLPAARHRVRPGLTGLAQVAGRNAAPWARRLSLDLAYAEAPRLATDLLILLRTPLLLAAGIGARLGPALPEMRHDK